MEEVKIFTCYDPEMTPTEVEVCSSEWNEATHSETHFGVCLAGSMLSCLIDFNRIQTTA